jgi:hypothetical protein
MRTSAQVRARRLALVSMAALGAVALSACGLARSGTGGVAGGTASATTTVSAASSASSAAASSAQAGNAATTGPAASSPATGATGVSGGGPVPAGFAATSVTFVSVDEAFVLGTAPCAHAPCTSIVRTLDRGVSWAGIPAPVVPLGDPYSNTSQPAAWGIRFASPGEGFVFGNGLWATTDGGEHWTAVAGPGHSIVDLEVIDGQLLTLTDRCTVQSGCSPAETLERRALAGGPWSVVAQVTSTRAIATQARVAAVLDGGSVVVTGDGGLSSATHATPCPDGSGSAGSAVAVTGPGSLALLCAGDAAMGSVVKTVYISSDLGATWVRAGTPPFGGDPLGISGGTAARPVVAAASGASWLYYSPDGGARWLVAFQEGDGGAGFNDLGFTTTADGVAVYGPVYQNSDPYGMPGKLLLTSDGGASWTLAKF